MFLRRVRSLTEDCLAGIGVRATSNCTEIIRATRTQDVLGETGRQTRELMSGVQRRLGFPWSSVEHFAKRAENRADYSAQAESVR